MQSSLLARRWAIVDAVALRAQSFSRTGAQA
jgi:hypothetical protein